MCDHNAELSESVRHLQKLAHIDYELSVSIHENFLEFEGNVELGVDVPFKFLFSNWDYLMGVVNLHYFVGFDSFRVF